MPKTETPTCACGEPSVVTVNGVESCAACLDRVIGDTVSGVQIALRQYYAQAAEDV